MAWNDQYFPWQGVPLNIQRQGVANQFSDYAIGQGFDPSSYYYTGGGDLQRLMAQLGMTDAEARAQVDAARLRDSDDALVQELGEQAGTKTLLDWFNANGYGLQGVDTGDKWIQQLRGPDGSVIGTDTFDVAADNRSVDRFAAAAAALIGGAAAYGGLGGVGAAGSGAGSAAGGTGTLGAGATGAGSAGLSTQALPAASELLGGLSSSSSLFNPMTMAPTFGGMTAGLGSASELLGGLSSESALFNPIAAAPESLTSVGYLGGGAAAPTVSTPGLGPEVTQGLGLSNPNPLALAPSLGGGSFLDAAKNLISGGGSLKDLGQVAAPILGAIGGAADAKKPDTMTQDRKMDPRMDAFVYGTGPNDTNSLLGAAQQWFNQNRSGTNADMTAGMDMLRSLYTSPQYQQGYQDMRNMGQGLLSQGVAGNPFTNPSAAPAGLLGGFTPTPRGQMPAGLLPVPTRRGSI